MNKYLVNGSVFGYECSDLTNLIDKVKAEDEVYIITDRSCDGTLSDMYNTTKQIIKNKIKVYLINIADDNSVFKPLASLMVSYDRYDIYEVVDRDVIKQDYLKRIQERNPNISEAMSMIDGGIVAYSEIATIMIGIESLVSEGNIEKLGEFIESHINNVESLSASLEYMKKLADVSNSKELLSSLEETRKKYEDAKARLDEADEKIKSAKDKKDEAEEKLGQTFKEVARLKASNDELKGQLQSAEGGSIINKYIEINTSSLKCKTRIVLYFKEVSYVGYVNTLIMELLAYLKLFELSYKLVIYDNKSEMLGCYKPLNVVDGKEYVANKANLLNKADKFVVVEPVPVILTDLLTSSRPEFNVVIIYDRMKMAKDLVFGNNVVKFQIINSQREYEEVKSMLKIVDTSSIITRTDATFAPEALDIPRIEGFSSMTDAAKSSKYFNLVTNKTGKKLVESIVERARIQEVFGL